MKKLFAATVILAAMSTAFSALAQAPNIPKDQPYATARKSLLKRGWKPVHAPDQGFECMKGDKRCEGRPETVNCAGTGLANCLFRWKRKGVVIDVNTVGEDAPTVTGVQCKAGC
jgi:hypothetical protein